MVRQRDRSERSHRARMAARRLGWSGRALAAARASQLDSSSGERRPEQESSGLAEG